MALIEWTQKVVLEFLDLYMNEPTIWNTKHADYNDRTRSFEAWKRIQQNLSLKCSLKELKKKKEALMASYRKLALKERMRKRKNPNDSYSPTWFAYNKMASFLETVYKPRGCAPYRESEKRSGDLVDPLDYDMAESITFHSLEYHQDNEMSDEASTAESTTNQPKIIKTEVEETLEGLLEEPEHSYQENNLERIQKDECSLFCDLLCLKLRALDEDTRDTAMHEINGLMFHLKNTMRKQQQTTCDQNN